MPESDVQSDVEQLAFFQMPERWRCRICGEEKPLDLFTMDRNVPIGRTRMCKVCAAARVKAYYERHPERRKQARRKDYERHGAAYRARMRRRARENPEQVRAEKREYHRRNPEVARLNARRRKYRLGLATTETREWARTILADPCAYCGSPTEQIDHVVPISRGGDHDWTNLIGACESCNRHKHANSLLQFLMEDR